MLPTANAGQYATFSYKLLLFWLPHKLLDFFVCN